jgi:hypothetical protein
MIIGLTGGERELFRKGLEAFETVSSVQGDAFVPQTEGRAGLHIQSRQLCGLSRLS